MTPLTGAIIDPIRRPEPLDAREQAFADWAASRGLAVMFSKAYPLEDDEDFGPFLTYALAIEEKVGEKILGFQMTVEPTDYEPQLEVLEQLLRAGHERVKEENPA